MMAILKNKNRIWDIIFALLWICGSAFIIWKCRYGFANMDEAFYLTIPYRLTQGDGLMAQEWHLSQLAGFLIYPVMKIYLLFHSGTEGLFLTFRYIYTAIQMLVSVFIYVRLRKTSRPGAVVAAIVFLIYAPFGIMALSYNSLGIINLTLALVIMFSAERIRWLWEMIAGLFFAAAVLCCPYLISIFVIYIIAAIVAAIWRRKKSISNDNTIFRFKSLLFFSVGAALLAVVFAIFVLSRASISDIIVSLPYILNDQAHERRGLIQLVITYFKALISVSRGAGLCYALIAVTCIIALIDRKRREHAFIYLAIASFFTIVAAVFMVWYGSYINYVMFPINIMALICAALDWNDTIRKLALGFWIPAMIYTFCIHASSNMAYYAISSAATVASVASIMMISICARDIFANSRTKGGYMAIVCVAVLFAGQIVSVAALRYKAVFWSSMGELQSTAQNEGVEKGLFLSDDAKEQYDRTSAISSYIEENYPGDGELLLLTDSIWMYLQCPDKRNASYSGWMVEVGDLMDKEDMNKLMAYYDLNPHKIPDIIYMEKDYTDYIDDMGTFAQYDVTVLDADRGYILEKIQ